MLSGWSRTLGELPGEKQDISDWPEETHVLSANMPHTLLYDYIIKPIIIYHISSGCDAFSAKVGLLSFIFYQKNSIFILKQQDFFLFKEKDLGSILETKIQSLFCINPIMLHSNICTLLDGFPDQIFHLPPHFLRDFVLPPDSFGDS
jgi:hypothetical protein